MAKNIHGTRSDLIHCDNCGEDYSSTYKRCPFCGARPASTTPSAGRAAAGGRAAQNTTRSSRPPEDEDDYVFDGQDVFDDYDQERGSSRGGGGGRHLSGGILDIPPATLIGFVVSGVIVIAAILIVLFVVIPMIRGGQVETATNSPNKFSPSASQSQSVSPSPLPTETGSPSADPSADPSTDPTAAPSTSPDPAASASPSPSPSASVPPASGSLTIVTAYNGSPRSEISISNSYPDPVQFQARGGSGSVTWKSNNTAVATVSATGLVTGVSKGEAYITATDSAGNSANLRVLVTTSSPTAPSASTSPSPSPSASPSPSPSTSPAPSQSPTPSGGSLAFSAFGRTVDDISFSSAYPNPVTLRVTGASGTVTWSTSNSAVATVNASGTVSMVGKGQCTITATDASGHTGTCIVRVN